MMKKIAVINEFSIEAIKDALQKLDDFENLYVNGLGAYQLSEIEKIDASLFYEISEKIKSGRWNPCVGMWLENDNEISDENLSRNILYSSKYFSEKFGTDYHVLYSRKIYNNNFPQLVFKGRFDSAVVESEKEIYWLDGIDTSRILVLGGLETVDVNDIDDEFITSNEFTTYEELSRDIYSSPLDVKSVKLGKNTVAEIETENKVLLAEKISTLNNEDKTEAIENCWKMIFGGEYESAEKEADEIIGGRTFDDNFIKIDDSEIQLVCYKFCDDGSGDRFFRIRENNGKAKTLQIVCNEIELGIRCEIIPYETQNFRVDKDGFVKETFIQE